MIAQISFYTLKNYKKIQIEHALIIGVAVYLFSAPIFVGINLLLNPIQELSDAFIRYNPISSLIELRNPDTLEKINFQLKTAWPVRGIVTTEFDDPNYPYNFRHEGTDIACAENTPVGAFSDGKVISIDTEGKGNYGKNVVIQHENNLTSKYGHLNSVDVKVGQDIVTGQILGKAGSTGLSTGVHVHFEIRYYEIPVNPRNFFGFGPSEQVVNEVANL